MKRFMTRQEVKDRNESSKKWKRTSCGILAMTLLVSSVALSGCGSKEAEEASTEETVTAVQVETAVPSTNTIQVFSDFIGTVEASEETSIIPKIAGEVTSKNFEVGDFVNAGDLLFTIDDTALQITKQTAEASVMSATANVESAQAGLIAQQASNGATKASVNETLGTQGTTEMQLQNGVNSAKRSVGAAKGSNGLANQSFSTYQDATGRVDDNRQAAENSEDNLQNYLDYLKKLQSSYNDISHAGDPKQEVINKGISRADADAFEAAGKTSGADYADFYLSKTTSFSSGSALSAMISSTSAEESSASTQRRSLEGSYSSALLAQIQAAIQTQTTADSLRTAEEAQKLAEKMLEDYHNYTKNTINANANAQIVGGDAAVIASNSQLTSATANLSSANAQLASANLQLDYTKVTAPISGVIQQINVKQYEMASNQSAAYVISSANSKKVTFYVAENAMKNMTMGQAVTIEKEGNTYDASISNIESTVDAQKGLFKVEVTLTGTGADTFITGTSVKLTTATQQAVDAMTVPIDAVYYESQQAYVYCAVDGVATRTDITTGISDETNVEVLSGLTATDKVITSWASQLKDGAVIEEAVTAEEPVTEETTEEVATESSADVEAKAQTEGADSAGELVETTDNVNIRAAATTESEKVGMAVVGQKYNRIEETADGWSKIEFEGTDAYVKTEYLKAVDSEETASEEPTEEVTTEETTPTQAATEVMTEQEETVNE